MNIRLHKELNRQPIKFEKELNIRMYKEIVLKINKAESLEIEYKFSNQELREKLGIRKKEELLQFQKYFHSEGVDRKDIFILDEKFSLGGGVFSSKVYLEERSIGFMINPYWKKYFYSRLDIDQWHSVGGKPDKIKELEVEDLQKEKLNNMITSVINHSIKGKYSQRLIDLLSQQKGSGFFVMKWKEFKDVMEIPDSVRGIRIDEQVLGWVDGKIWKVKGKPKGSAHELKKVGIKITKIDKIKKGRFIDTIKIFFKMEKVKPEEEILEAEIVESNIFELDGAIQKAKKNIYVSKAWNKRTDNKIQKVLQEYGEEFTVSLLNKLYDNLQQEVKTTLVQYINGITKNMELEKEEIQEKEEKKKKNITPKQLQGVGVSKGKSEELKKELTEEDQTPEQIKNSLLGKIQIKEGIRPFTPEGKKEIKLLDGLSIKELEKRLNGTEPEEEEPYILPERSERRKVHLKRLVSEIKSDLDFFGTGYKGVRKKADLVEILLDTEDRYNN